MLRPTRIADAPAGHAVGLRHAVERERALVESGLDLRRAEELEVVVDQVLVHVVRERPHMRMPHQHLGDRLHLGARIGRTGRVRRRIEDQPLGILRDRTLERLRLHLEAILEPRRHCHRRGARQQHNVRVADPIGRRNDNLVARIERRHQGVEQHLLAAGADDDLGGLVVELVLALELARDRRLGRLTTLDRRNGGLLDVVRRVEIRLAHPEPNHVAARRFERARHVRHRDGGRWLDALKRVREKGHRNLLLPRVACQALRRCRNGQRPGRQA